MDLNHKGLNCNIRANPGGYKNLIWDTRGLKVFSVIASVTKSFIYVTLMNYFVSWSYNNFFCLLASFYGESYIQLKVAETVYEISLKLRFQTNKPDGLLFLASGKEDYFLVELNSGNIQVRL